MAINYKSSKELQLLLLFLSCPKFLGCTFCLFLACYYCLQRLPSDSWAEFHSKSTAPGHWSLDSHWCAPLTCTLHIWCMQLSLRSAHFTFMALVCSHNWEYYQSHPQASKVRLLLRGSLGSAADDETGFAHWKSIPTLGVVQRSALDVSAISPWGHNLAQWKKKKFLHDSELCNHVARCRRKHIEAGFQLVKISGAPLRNWHSAPCLIMLINQQFFFFSW